MDRYEELITTLFSLPRTFYPSDNPPLFYEKLDRPADHYKTIHVAGTNGKGSVALKIASTLESAGYKVGLFISPHIESFRERIQINREKIPRERVVFYLDYLYLMLKDRWVQSNFFEISTMLAFLYFRDEKVDVAVIEAGIGGRHDATNVIHPVLSVITTVTLDHEAFLGPTPQEIAYQKAGIIKKEVPVVLGYRSIYPAVFQEAFIRKAPVTITPPYEGNSYAVENRHIAEQALFVLRQHFSIPDHAMQYGLSQEQPCRFEEVLLEELAPIIFDVAHNSDGFTRLIQRLKDTYPGKNYHFVFGISKEKDYISCIKIIGEVAKEIYLVRPSYNKGLDVHLLKEAFQNISHQGVKTHATVEETMQKLIETTNSHEDVIVISGTFYIMEPIRRFVSSLKKGFQPTSGNSE